MQGCISCDQIADQPARSRRTSGGAARRPLSRACIPYRGGNPVQARRRSGENPGARRAGWPDCPADRDPAIGKEVEIDCTKLGGGAYSIPHSVKHLRFRTDAQFVLTIETGGMFQRLNNHQFWDTSNCVLVEMGGVSTRATRRFIRRLSDQHDLPVYCFDDYNPYGFTNIYRTLKVGSGSAADISQFFCVPRARFLGVTPRDINDFGLGDAIHPLSKSDKKHASDALKNDPFIASHPERTAAIEKLLGMGVRAEQRALAEWGLNYVIDECWPRKLADPDTFLP